MWAAGNTVAGNSCNILSGIDENLGRLNGGFPHTSVFSMDKTSGADFSSYLTVDGTGLKLGDPTDQFSSVVAGGELDLQMEPPYSSSANDGKQVCKYFLTGGCSRGADCTFSHVLPDERHLDTEGSGFIFHSNVQNASVTAAGSTNSIQAAVPTSPAAGAGGNSPITNAVAESVSGSGALSTFQQQLAQSQNLPSLIGSSKGSSVSSFTPALPFSASVFNSSNVPSLCSTNIMQGNNTTAVNGSIGTVSPLATMSTLNAEAPVFRVSHQGMTQLSQENKNRAVFCINGNSSNLTPARQQAAVGTAGNSQGLNYRFGAQEWVPKSGCNVAAVPFNPVSPVASTQRNGSSGAMFTPTQTAPISNGSFTPIAGPLTRKLGGSGTPSSLTPADVESTRIQLPAPFIKGVAVNPLADYPTGETPILPYCPPRPELTDDLPPALQALFPHKTDDIRSAVAACFTTAIPTPAHIAEVPERRHSINNSIKSTPKAPSETENIA